MHHSFHINGAKAHLELITEFIDDGFDEKHKSSVMSESDDQKVRFTISSL